LFLSGTWGLGSGTGFYPNKNDKKISNFLMLTFLLYKKSSL
jgi:hypothetical protein